MVALGTGGTIFGAIEMLKTRMNLSGPWPFVVAAVLALAFAVLLNAPLPGWVGDAVRDFMSSFGIAVGGAAYASKRRNPSSTTTELTTSPGTNAAMVVKSVHPPPVQDEDTDKPS